MVCALNNLIASGKRYRVILADPPWPYSNINGKVLGASQGPPDSHYKTMSINDICALPVGKIAEKNSALFLWTTGPKLDCAFPVLKAWGFRYATVVFAWVKTVWGPSGKPAMGMGFYTRTSVELVLLGIKGKMWGTRKPGTIAQVIAAPRREHSRKPEEIYERIEALFDGPYIELFARSQRPGWGTWGNETGKFSDPKGSVLPLGE